MSRAASVGRGIRIGSGLRCFDVADACRLVEIATVKLIGARMVLVVEEQICLAGKANARAT